MVQTIDYGANPYEGFFSPNYFDISSSSDLLVANLNVSMIKVWRRKAVDSSVGFVEELTIASDDFQAKVESIQMSETGDMIVVGYRDSRIKIWTASRAEKPVTSRPTKRANNNQNLNGFINEEFHEIQTLSRNSDSVLSVDLCRAKKRYIVSGSNDGKVLLWKLNNDTKRFEFSTYLLELVDHVIYCVKMSDI